jgi:hypothetical protein
MLNATLKPDEEDEEEEHEALKEKGATLESEKQLTQPKDTITKEARLLKLPHPPLLLKCLSGAGLFRRRTK